MKNFKFIAKVGLSLFVICTIVALLLAVVNGLTKDKIAENNNLKMQETIASIFGEGIELQDTDVEIKDSVNAVYTVTKDGTEIGYAVYVTPQGFKAPIEMMVGINPDGSVMDVKIISLSETPGLGSKVEENDFIGQYKGGLGEFTVKGNITPVAGATISSTAVTTGVNDAMNAVGGLNG